MKRWWWVAALVQLGCGSVGEPSRQQLTQAAGDLGARALVAAAREAPRLLRTSRSSTAPEVPEGMTLFVCRVDIDGGEEIVAEDAERAEQECRALHPRTSACGCEPL